MPREYTKYLANAEWDNPEKRKSRAQSVINPYRKYFGHSLSPEKQYWTLCGAHFNKTGPLQGELGHMIQAGLVTPDQFHGVDREPDIITRNQQLHPESNWHCGDFREVMYAASDEGTFNPAIINYDGVAGIPNAVYDVIRIFWLIDSNVREKLLFSINVLLRLPYKIDRIKQGIEFMEPLQKQHNIPDHWALRSTYYSYPGAVARSQTVMGVFTFIKESHDSNDMKFTGKRLDRLT